MKPLEPLAESQSHCNKFSAKISNEITQLETDIAAWEASDRTDIDLYNTLEQTIAKLSGAVEIYEQDVAEHEYLVNVHDGELLN